MFSISGLPFRIHFFFCFRFPFFFSFGILQCHFSSTITYTTQYRLSSSISLICRTAVSHAVRIESIFSVTISRRSSLVGTSHSTDRPRQDGCVLRIWFRGRTFSGGFQMLNDVRATMCSSQKLADASGDMVGRHHSRTQRQRPLHTYAPQSTHHPHPFLLES